MGRVTDTISGSLATFRTPYKQDIRHLKAYFTPKQEGSGTPSPENVRPITGWTGVRVGKSGRNLFNLNVPLVQPSNTATAATNKRVFTGGTYCNGASYSNYYIPNQVFVSEIGNGSITVAATNGYGVGFPIEIIGGKSYRVSATATGTQGFVNIASYDAEGNFITPAITTNYMLDYVYTAPQNAVIAVVIFRNQTNSTDKNTTTFSNIQFEVGDTKNTVEDFKSSQVLPIDWSSAGTVYGGYVDLVTGEVYATYRNVDLSTLSFELNSGRFLSRTGLSSAPAKNNSQLEVPNLYADIYKPAKWYQGVVSTDYTAGVYGQQVMVGNPDYTTVADFKAAMAGKQFIYELATPQLVTTLTPTELRTLIGTNNIWCNSGDVSVEYDFAESREMMEARKRALFSMIWIGGRDMKLKKIGTYTVTESWENDQKGNPVTIMNTLVPDRDDTNYEVDYWLEFIGNATSNTNYKVDGIFWNPIETGNKGFVIRNNRSAYRVNSSSTSTWVSVGTRINIYKIQLFS